MFLEDEGGASSAIHNPSAAERASVIAEPGLTLGNG